VISRELALDLLSAHVLTDEERSRISAIRSEPPEMVVSVGRATWVVEEIEDEATATSGAKLVEIWKVPSPNLPVRPRGFCVLGDGRAIDLGDPAGFGPGLVALGAEADARSVAQLFLRYTAEAFVGGGPHTPILDRAELAADFGGEIAEQLEQAEGAIEPRLTESEGEPVCEFLSASPAPRGNQGEFDISRWRLVLGESAEGTRRVLARGVPFAPPAGAS